MNNLQPVTTTIPTSESLKLTSHTVAGSSDPPLPPSVASETALKRDEWMLMPPSAPSVPEDTSRLEPLGREESYAEGYGEPSQNVRTTAGNVDFFSSLGTEKKKKPKPDVPDPDKVRIKSFNIHIWSLMCWM